VKRPVIVRGTAKDLADHGVGYVSTGEGQWTRQAAQPGNTKLAHFHENAPGTRRFRGPRSKADSLRLNEAELVRLRNAASFETNPTRLAKLRKNIDIKSTFLRRLQSE
jgi:hypothetical protein